MFQYNFWDWLLLGFQDWLIAYINQFPIHSAIGLAEFFGTIAFYTVVFLTILVGSFIHLEVFALVFITMVSLESVRAAFAAWRWLKTLLPHSA